MADQDSTQEPEPGSGSAQGLFTKISNGLKALLGRVDPDVRDVLEELIEEETTGELHAEEKLLLNNILKLEDLTVADCMVPRAKIVAVDINQSLIKLATFIAAEAHSRVPAYRDNPDDIVGMIYAKDVLSALATDLQTPVEALVRPLPMVPATLPVLTMLRQMRQTRQHMALIVDEFGDIDGLITIEDVVEEIVGEIDDEHDEAAQPSSLAAVEGGALVVDAAMPLDDFAAQTSITLSAEERDEVDTIGGLVFALAGQVPSQGDVVTHPASGASFEVVEADGHRITKLRVRNLDLRAIADLPAAS